MTGGGGSGRRVLCLNAGSSSLRAALFELLRDGKAERVESVRVDGIGEDTGTLTRTTPDGGRIRSPGRFTDHGEAFSAVFSVLEAEGEGEPAAVGHRLVRGPLGCASPAILDSGLMERLDGLAASAPLHLPAQLAGVRAAGERFPPATQVACFDSAFFSRLPAVARRLPLPRDLGSAGIERIGYHGLSYESVTSRLDLPRRCVIAHLGSGASMAALLDGEPVDTTMGFTPTGGLVMGTRSGDLDPGALVEAMRRLGLDADGLERLVSFRSGLAGLSGGEADMETLLGAEREDDAAREAVESFCYAARKHLGAMIAVLGGIDLLVFTGGIGENAAEVRWRILEGLGALGLEVDPDANRRDAATISTDTSAATIRVVHTDEDLVIVGHVAGLVFEDDTKGTPP